MTLSLGVSLCHQDVLGNVVALTSGTGTLIQQYRYTVWGEPQVFNASNQLRPISEARLPFLFTAREFDMDTSLYHYRARAYSPQLGRLLQFDPIDFGGGDRNLARYVSNDPISIADLLGLWQHYENWGGQGWTNGQHHSETDNFPMPGQPSFRPPVDARDHAYFAHDVCLHNCSTLRCPEPRRKCRRQCDKELANDLRDIGGTFLEILLFDRFKPNNNTGKFNPHTERFPRIARTGFTDYNFY